MNLVIFPDKSYSTWTVVTPPSLIPITRPCKSKIPTACFIWKGDSNCIKLRREDCYLSPGVPRLAILFRSRNLKQGAGHYQSSIEVPIAKPLKLSLIEYKFSSDLSPWVFEGKDRENHISRQSCDRSFRQALKIAGLDRAGYSLHGFKRNFIQKLHQENASFAEIKALTGNQSLKSIQSYLEGNPHKMKSLIDRIF